MQIIIIIKGVTLVDNFNGKELNDNELDAVAGGLTIQEQDNKFDKLFTKIKTKCVECGDEIEVIDNTKTPMAMIGSEFDRYNYYHNRCKKCALNKPYWKDKVVNNEIIKDGRINELFQKANYTNIGKNNNVLEENNAVMENIEK